MLDRTIDGLVILKRFGTHPSLDPNCYQKINQFKIDLKMIYSSLPYQGTTDSSIISKQQNCIYLILQRMQIFLMISLLPNLHL